MYNFKKGVSEKSINEILSSNNLEIIDDDESDIGLYLVRVKNMKESNPIEVANRLHANSDVEFAEPNFITEIKKESSIVDGKYFSKEWHLSNTGQRGGVKGEDVSASEGLGNIKRRGSISHRLLYG